VDGPDIGDYRRARTRGLSLGAKRELEQDVQTAELCRSGFFSSDRSINEYASASGRFSPVPITNLRPDPSAQADQA